jgi:hypothetical protein
MTKPFRSAIFDFNVNNDKPYEISSTPTSFQSVANFMLCWVTLKTITSIWFSHRQDAFYIENGLVGQNKVPLLWRLSYFSFKF